MQESAVQRINGSSLGGCYFRGLDLPAHENPLLLKIQPDMIKELNVPDYIL